MNLGFSSVNSTSISIRVSLFVYENMIWVEKDWKKLF